MSTELSEVTAWHMAYRKACRLAEASPMNLIYQYLAAEALMKEMTLSLSYFWGVSKNV